MGRIFYTVPVVIKSRTNTAYTTPQKRRHEIRTGVARVRRICSLSRKGRAREVEVTGRGRLCDGCHIKRGIREAVTEKKYYYPEMWTKIKEHERGQRKYQKAMIRWLPFWPIFGFMFGIIWQRGRNTYTRIVMLHVCKVVSCRVRTEPYPGYLPRVLPYKELL